MTQQQNQKVTVLYKDNYMANLFEGLDRLHSAASEGKAHEITSLSAQEMTSWLQELIYTAQETIYEINRPSVSRVRKEVVLRVIDTSKRNQQGA